MARSVDYSEQFADAFAIGRKTSSYDYGWRKFRQRHSDIDRKKLRNIFDRVWDRTQRVRYIDDTPGHHFTSKKKLGCPSGGNRLFFTFRVSFTDEDGGQHDQYKHVNIPLMSHVGKNLHEAHNELIRQMRSTDYFKGWTIAAIRGMISSIQTVQVKCLTGGD